MLHAPIHKRRLYRPWLWPHKFITPWIKPLPFGLWLLNVFCQRIIGINNQIPWMVNFTSRVTGNISIGRKVWESFALSGGCYIQGLNGVEIGDDTIFAPGVKIISANHESLQYHNWIKSPPIIIGKRCWIGANAVILPGVQLGDDVIIGAGSIVTKNFPSGSVAYGVPAKNNDTKMN